MIILALCFISEKKMLFVDTHLHMLFLKVPICLCAKGHRQQNFFFDFSWKWTKSRLSEVRTVSRKSALKTWKSISEFKPIAIFLLIPCFQMSYFRWNLPRTERSFIRENSNIAFLYMNQCPIVFELYARVEELTFSEIHLYLSFFGRSSGKYFTGH